MFFLKTIVEKIQIKKDKFFINLKEKNIFIFFLNFKKLTFNCFILFFLIFKEKFNFGNIVFNKKK